MLLCHLNGFFDKIWTFGTVCSVVVPFFSRQTLQAFFAQEPPETICVAKDCEKLALEFMSNFVASVTHVVSLHKVEKVTIT